MILYQAHINECLYNFTLDNTPRTILVYGDKGCGKHLFCKELSTKLSIPIEDITDKVSQELADSIYESSTMKLYLVEVESIGERGQNVLLKLMEEPPIGGYIVVVCESLERVLTTVKNRCYLVGFAPYPKDALQNFPHKYDWDYYRFCTTPGQVIEMDGEDVIGMYALAEKMVDKMRVASIPNALSLANKLRYKEEKDKFPIVPLLRMVRGICGERVINGDVGMGSYFTHFFFLTSDVMRVLSTTNIDKKMAIEHYIMKVKQLDSLCS